MLPLQGPDLRWISPNSCHRRCRPLRQVQPHASSLWSGPRAGGSANQGGRKRAGRGCAPGLRPGEVPDQMLLLSAASAPRKNSPGSPYLVTFISQLCQTNPVQTQTYRIHTSVPDKCPWGFWAAIPGWGDGDDPPIGTMSPPKAGVPQVSTAPSDSASALLGWFARRWGVQEGFNQHGKYLINGVSTLSEVFIQKSKVR